ncbi:MAG: aminotransferase class I/II-fold pyridoxal phosphate-dependent enzyme [Candidatus Falkowbacteria bacterium]
MRKSRLPDGGINLFQSIKKVKMEAKADGNTLIDLSIGQPFGPALQSARNAASVAILSKEESMHEYQDNGSPGVEDFASKFVDFHVMANLRNYDVDYLPTPGTKPMLGLIPLACGAGLKAIATTTNPGYPTPRDWCQYLGLKVIEPELNSDNNFLFNPYELDGKDVGLVMINYPHNPSGAVASRLWLETLCTYCEDNNIRIFNDAAYSALAYDNSSCCLSDVAVDFPDLSWAEAFSASKLIDNGTGWRIGAMVGSKDFIGDIKTIKGNTDSGFVAPMAFGVLAAIENDQKSIIANMEKYKRRTETLCGILLGAGMRPAITPKAGFFTLWEVPKFAFARKIEDARDFNFAMIEKFGVVGVHFGKYIRYSVACVEIEDVADKIEEAFKYAFVDY